MRLGFIRVTLSHALSGQMIFMVFQSMPPNREVCDIYATCLYLRKMLLFYLALDETHKIKLISEFLLFALVLA